MDQGLLFLVKCTLQNTGTVEADEVVMLFHAVDRNIRGRAMHPVPLRTLREFTRQRVRPGTSVLLTWNFEKAKALALINAQGEKVLYSGTHHLYITRGNPDQPDVRLSIKL